MTKECLVPVVHCGDGSSKFLRGSPFVALRFSSQGPPLTLTHTDGSKEELCRSRVEGVLIDGSTMPLALELYETDDRTLLKQPFLSAFPTDRRLAINAIAGQAIMATHEGDLKVLAQTATPA